MRKSQSFKENVICKTCGREAVKTNANQEYCKECAAERAKQRKREYQARKYPNRKPRAECANRKPCDVCGEKAVCEHEGKPYCNKHWQSLYRYGTPYGNPRKSTNTIKKDGDTLIITTKRGNIILADSEDCERLSKYSWCISKTGYAVANTGKRVEKMHRYILEGKLTDGDIVDHANRNRLDNRKANLRVCTQRENGKNLSMKNTNTTGATGVRVTKYGKYEARIVADGTEIYIGSFDTLELAVEARKREEKKQYGEYAPNNERRQIT